MNTPLRILSFTGVLCIVTTLTAQTLTEAASIPSSGMIVNFNHYYDATASGLAISGAGNTWDATGATSTGIYDYYIYAQVPGSPYAATYPTATLCAEVQSNGGPAEWRYWNVSASLAELIGVNTDAFVGGRTLCEFPFSQGSSFTDSYTVGGNTITDQVEYVASGTISAPWGEMPNVAMYAINGGAAYAFYSVENALEQVGSYVPGFGLQVEEVNVLSGIEEESTAPLAIWPSPASHVAHINLPFSGTSFVTIRDASGRSVHERRASSPLVDVDLDTMAPGIYLVTAVNPLGKRSTGRLVVR